MNLFENSISIIKKNESHFNLGWRFLTTAKKTLEKNNGFYLITMNPGGSRASDYEGHGVESCENGAAYFEENWGAAPGESKLQKQIIGLFEIIAKKLDQTNTKEFLEDAVCGHFVPYRSPNWDSVEDDKKFIGINVGTEIWKNIISLKEPKTIICIDHITYNNIKKILIDLKFEEIRECNYGINWGNIKCSIGHFEREKDKIKVLRLPHLSRFSIINRPKSEKQVDRIINDLLIDIKI